MRKLVAVVAIAGSGCSIHHRSDEIQDASGQRDSPQGGGHDAKLADAKVNGVKDVPGLVLWLDGTAGITRDAIDRVSRWADQSGQGNDAVAAQAANRPMFVAGSINQQPGIHFGLDGTPQLL